MKVYVERIGSQLRASGPVCSLEICNRRARFYVGDDMRPYCRQHAGTAILEKVK